MDGSARVGDWVRASRAGAPRAEELLVPRATRLALRTAAAVLSDREEASDVAQDVAVAAREELQRGLATLPVRQHLALVLRWVHDLSDEDIAAALGCRPGTVHALLSRGRVALGHHLGGDHVTDAVAGGCP